jgi:hypothetical protein
MLRDMLGTIPGGEEFFTGLLGMGGPGDAAGRPPFLSGGVRAARSACKGEYAAYEDAIVASLSCLRCVKSFKYTNRYF